MKSKVYDKEYADIYWHNRKYLLENELKELAESMFDYADADTIKEFEQAFRTKDACEIGRLFMQMVADSATETARDFALNGEKMKKLN